MNNYMIYDTIEQQELARLIDRKQAYLQRLEPQSKQAPYLASEIALLRRVLAALQLGQNHTLTALTESIAQQLSKVSRHSSAQEFTGLLYYYKMREPEEERRNLIAVTSGALRDELRIKDCALWDGYEECAVDLILL